MRIVVAPNAFKGTLSAEDTARAIATGIVRALPEADTILAPVADGGDGTLDVVLRAGSGVRRSHRVTGPLGHTVAASWAITDGGRSALIEGAQAFGLALVPESARNPGVATSRGLGELIRHGLDLGIGRFVLAIGGSAANDGGSGMMRALGVRFLDDLGRDLEEGGLALRRLARIDTSGQDPRLAEATFVVWSDSSAPLTGDTGVSLMYAPGKGASPEMARALEEALLRYAARIRTQLGKELIGTPSTGSGGGAAGAAHAFLNAEVVLGCEAVLDAIALRRTLRGADLVITGEGRVDAQTVYHKAPIGVVDVARTEGVLVLAICATSGDGWEKVLDRGLCGLAVVAEADGWARPGAVVREHHLARAAEDVTTQISGFLRRRAAPPPRGHRFRPARPPTTAEGPRHFPPLASRAGQEADT